MTPMLTTDFFYMLCRSHSLEEGIQLLKGTEFEIVTNSFMMTGDLKMGELDLFNKEIKFYTELEPFYPTNFKPLVHALLLKYEIDVFKSVLRLWFDKYIRNRDISSRLGYIYRKTILNKMPINKILNCSQLEQIATLLKDTPYYTLFLSEYNNIKKYQSIFMFETSLDILYFSGIFTAINKLNIKDKKIALKYYNYVVDIENIKWANRFREFEIYKEINFRDIFIPYGQIDKQLYNRLLISDDSEFVGIIKKINSKVFVNIDDKFPIENAISQLEMTINSFVNRLLRRDPFSIGIFIAYFYKKQLEISKLIMVLNAISYGLPEKRIRGLL